MLGGVVDHCKSPKIFEYLEKVSLSGERSSQIIIERLPPEAKRSVPGDALSIVESSFVD